MKEYKKKQEEMDKWKVCYHIISLLSDRSTTVFDLLFPIFPLVISWAPFLRSFTLFFAYTRIRSTLFPDLVLCVFHSHLLVSVQKLTSLRIDQE